MRSQMHKLALIALVAALVLAQPASECTLDGMGRARLRPSQSDCVPATLNHPYAALHTRLLVTLIGHSLRAPAHPPC
jgi:hypothetical protein